MFNATQKCLYFSVIETHYINILAKKLQLYHHTSNNIEFVYIDLEFLFHVLKAFCKTFHSLRILKNE